jgi:TPP-dependent pyruvate/acetoin dehydrogenase alpha subunit
MEKYLMDQGVLAQEKVDSLEEEIKAEIQAAVERAEQRTSDLGDPLDMFEHVYAEATPTLQEQREELGQELAAAGEVENHG